MNSGNNVILRHIVTEKAAKSSSDFNQYTFEVKKTSNKVQVKQSINEIFNKKVLKVRIINVKPKVKASRTHRGHFAINSGYKKAIISLKAGESIEIV